MVMPWVVEVLRGNVFLGKRTIILALKGLYIQRKMNGIFILDIHIIFLVFIRALSL